MPEHAKKVHVIQCEMALAKYWGTCGETIINAVEIIRDNPKTEVEEALRLGFKRSAEKLMPLPVSRK